MKAVTSESSNQSHTVSGRLKKPSQSDITFWMLNWKLLCLTPRIAPKNLGPLFIGNSQDHLLTFTCHSFHVYTQAKHSTVERKINHHLFCIFEMNSFYILLSACMHCIRLLKNTAFSYEAQLHKIIYTMRTTENVRSF